MRLKTKFWTYNLELIKSRYTHNDNLYLGLIDKKTGEPFCDLSVNPEYKLEENEIIIDNDFKNIFENSFQLYQRIIKNLKPKARGKNYHSLGDSFIL